MNKTIAIKLATSLLPFIVLLSSCFGLRLNQKEQVTNNIQDTTVLVDDSPTIRAQEAPLPVYAPSAQSEETGGSDNFCKHSGAYENSYHIYSGVLISYLGEENFIKWISESEKLSAQAKTPDCIYSKSNISELISYFNIPKEDFQKLYKYTYAHSNYDYNVDLLYTRDTDKIEEYYSGSGTDRFHEEMEKRSLIRRIKQEFVIDTYGGTLNNEKYIQWLNELGKDDIITWMKENTGQNAADIGEQLWSLPQFIYDHNITSEKCSKILEHLRGLEGMRFDLFEYDLQKIYDDNSAIKQAIEERSDAEIVDYLAKK